MRPADLRVTDETVDDRAAIPISIATREIEA
jgi:hypothetical protein